MKYDHLLRDVPDFPKPGVMFKDIGPLLGNPQALFAAAHDMAAPFHAAGVTVVAGLESRGFIFGALVALNLNVGFVPIRKKGKLPGKVVQYEYKTEYSTDCIEVADDAFEVVDRVLIVDDILATGGTAEAAYHLLQPFGVHVVGFSFLYSITDLLGGMRLVDKARVTSALVG